MSINPVTTALMPISQTVAWYLVSTTPATASLFQPVGALSTFYCLWALYNKYLGGTPQELGHISMGLLALASFSEKRVAAIAATLLVLLNFAVPAYTVLSWSAEEAAKIVKKTTSKAGIIWAYIWKAYFVSSICFWSVVLYKFIKMPSNYTPVAGSS
jgi:hypothetical protein